MKPNNNYSNSIRLLYFALLLVVGTAAFAFNSINNENYVRRSAIEFVKEYQMAQEKTTKRIMVYNSNDFLLADETLKGTEKPDEELSKLLLESDLLFDYNETSYYIKTK